MLGFAAMVLLRGVLFFINILPLRVRLAVLGGLIRLLMANIPRYRKIALRNLERAFPQRDQKWREEIIDGSYRSLARVIVDFARLHTLDNDWFNKHVECPFLPRFKEMKKENPGKGIVIATGHLGSFELLAHAVATYGFPIAFVVRNFKLKAVDQWWTSNRERNGNRVIPRKGAVREIVRYLGEGRDVALLFDQNVTKKHAVFVDLFGYQAATTRTLAVAALRTEAPVIVASITTTADDMYRINAVECDFRAVYADTERSFDDKVQLITQELSKKYEKMIEADPASWFWMHRRWKTRPDGEKEDFYL